MMRTPFDEPKYAPVVRPGEWLWAVAVMMLPPLNLLAACFWLFGRNTNPSKVNYAKALLMLYGWLAVAGGVAWVVLERSGYLPLLLGFFGAA
ncbi:hypothetical protein LVJ83_13145 [Uruburuella testudinis]|uniref:Uncharacterized protein n=1 Tax=Uruburuella testudinis TaxID=1282863 RepID=A0ABY4DTB0_9NEIS|nr:hypothetical protein [Uruburuella testudinis]UOO81832.1 hypothetical protein LVJ83_13145 [Uruburuella testudinis]